ncbi:MAG: hypothetical protein KC593_19115 [Myxococcales bacterium]|nr:hypothetical protein [Myxococcales bacterium]MCB9626625.1 hypothetical protein [Sandaracinaceae bacterium]
MTNRASLSLSLTAALLLIAGCGTATTPAAAPRTPPPVCPPLAADGGDPRGASLIERAAAGLAQGEHSSAVALLRAAASLGASPLDDPQARAALARRPLPVVAMLPTAVYERSADGRVVAFIAAPPVPLGAASDLPTLCDAGPLEWVDLARGTRGTMSVVDGAAGARLAPLLALDAQAAEQRELVHVLHAASSCDLVVDACGAEPQEPVERNVEPGYAAADLLPRHDLCGRVEALSPQGRFAVVALPDVEVGRLGAGTCVPSSRLGWIADSNAVVCVSTRYQVVSLAEPRVVLDAAHDTEAIRFAADERHAYVRTQRAARVVPLAPGLAEVTLAADCRGPVAFAPNGETLVASCGARLDVLTLGATVATRSIPIDTRGLGGLGSARTAAVAISDAGDSIALVFSPILWPRAHHRWALLDARGRVTYRVEDLPPQQSEATPVAPVYERVGQVPTVRTSSAGPGCGGYDRPYHGQTLALSADVGARFEADHFVLFGRHGHHVPAEFWTLRGGPQRRGDLSRMRFVQLASVLGAGEWMTSEPETPRSGRRLVFAHGVFDSRGGARGEIPADHALGPSRWDGPLGDPDDSAPQTAADVDVAGFLSATGARTNLRVCPDDLRVVAVLPMPPHHTVWADAATCAQAPPTPPPDSFCRSGRL